MIKKIIVGLALLAGICVSAEAQNIGRWTFSLSGVSGDVNSVWHLYSEVEKAHITETKLIPSLRYRLWGGLSVGVALDLPLSRPKDKLVRSLSTSAVELQLSQRIPLYRGLSFSLSAVGLIGHTGAYHSDRGVENVSGEMYLCATYDHIRLRWLAGLRPTLSYSFGRHWAVELGYGFWGYRSQEDVWHTAYRVYEPAKSKTYPKGAWGFDAGATWANSLRIGVAYTL